MSLTIFDIKQFAVHDGPGIRTTVFLKGCPLRCAWCHNPESFREGQESIIVERELDGKRIQMDKVYGEKWTATELLKEVLKDKVFFEESEGGVTISGGEPMMQFQGLKEFLTLLKNEGLHVALDTSGYVPEMKLREIMELIDVFLYDLKGMNDSRHKKYTGVGNAIILSNARMLMSEQQDVIFRIPYIPGVNDSEEEQELLLDFLLKHKDAYREVHLLPYHAIASQKYKRLGLKEKMKGVEPPAEETLTIVKNKMKSLGLKVSVGG